MTKMNRLLLIIFASASFWTFAQVNIDSIKKTLRFDRYMLYEYNSKGLLSKETEFDKNKKQTSYKTIEYDSLGRIKTEKDYQCCWKLFAKYENTYNPDSTIAKRTTYSNDKISNYIVYTYDRKKMTLAEFFNADNKLTTVNSVKYNNDGKTANFVFKMGDKVLFYKDYEYIGNTSIATKFNSSSRKTGLTESTYDNYKNEVKRIEKDSANKVTQTLEWVYKDNKKDYFKIINAKNKVTSLAIDSYDTLGRLVKTEWYEKRD